MNKIICIVDGKIAEEGTHRELLRNRNGYYSGMFDLSVDKYFERNSQKF